MTRTRCTKLVLSLPNPMVVEGRITYQCHELIDPSRSVLIIIESLLHLEGRLFLLTCNHTRVNDSQLIIYILIIISIRSS